MAWNRQTLAFSTLLVLAAFCQVSAAQTETTTASQQFDEMKSLTGRWKPHDSTSGNFFVEFEMTASESVLVEKWLYKDALHSMTVYHLDGDSMIATHYCPQGNQPRLASVPGNPSGEIYFIFRDATNLDKSAQSYQVELGFSFNREDGSVLRTETYESESGREPSEMILISAD